MSNEQEHNQNSAEESMPQGVVRDERIAPQSPRGQEPGAPSSVNSDEPVGCARHIVLVALAVLVLLAACACGVFACTVGAQDPAPIEAEQETDGAADTDASATESDAVAENADADAADEKDAAAGKNTKGKKGSKNKSKASAKNGKGSKSAKAGKNKSGGDKANGSQASGSGKESGSSSDGSSPKNNGGSGSGSGSGGNSGKHNGTTSNKITVTMSIDGSRAGDQDSASAAARKITVKRGSNVYDVLVASGVSIQGDATYVRSISGLAEFQCGGGSGWMYSVDGVFPNVSCGKYTLTGGERIVWAYTLNLGEDVK